MKRLCIVLIATALLVPIAAGVAKASPLTVKVTYSDGRPVSGATVNMFNTVSSGSEIKIVILAHKLTDSSGKAQFNLPNSYVCFKAMKDLGKLYFQGHACNRPPRRPAFLNIEVDKF